MARFLVCILLLCPMACGGDDQEASGPGQNAPAATLDMARAEGGLTSGVEMGGQEVDMKPEEVDMRQEDMSTPEEDMAPVAMVCGDPRKSACDGKCVNLQIDLEHCGECGRSCGFGAVCNDGACLCGAKADQTWCNSAEPCVDTKTNSNHCGGCGQKCSSTTYCVEGACVDSSSGSGGVFEEVLRLTNAARSRARVCQPGGPMLPAVGPLTYNGLLAKAAQAHSLDMFERNYFAHDTPEGVTPSQRMKKAGYKGGYTGENIARGYDTPKDVVDGWIDSPGHCVNIMRAGYKELGVGYEKGLDPPRDDYWTQNFGAP